MSETIGLSGLFRCRGLRRLFGCQVTNRNFIEVILSEMVLQALV